MSNSASIYIVAYYKMYDLSVLVATCADNAAASEYIANHSECKAVAVWCNK